MPGPIEYACDHCQKVLIIPSALIGKCVRCKFCKGLIEIPSNDDVITGRTIEVSAALVTPIVVPTLEPVKKKRKKRDLLDHRGGLIFSFGIISFVVPILGGLIHLLTPDKPLGLAVLIGLINLVSIFGLGLAAFFMGNRDVAKIGNGEMDSNGETATQIGRYLGLASLGWFILGGAITIFRKPTNEAPKIRENNAVVVINNPGEQNGSKRSNGGSLSKTNSPNQETDNRVLELFGGFKRHYQLSYDKNVWNFTESPPKKIGERIFDLTLLHKKLDAAFIVLVEEDKFEFDSILNARGKIYKDEGFKILIANIIFLNDKKGINFSLKKDHSRLWTMEFPGKKSSIEFRVGAAESDYPQAKRDFDKIMDTVYLDN